MWQINREFDSIFRRNAQNKTFIIILFLIDFLIDKKKSFSIELTLC